MTYESDLQGWRLLSRSRVPGVFEEAFAPAGVGSLKNPRATINEITPLAFEPGQEIRLNVRYTPVNEESWWQTAVVAKEGAVVLSQDRHQHPSMNPGQVTTVAKTGKIMGNVSVNLTLEVWAHGDYLHFGWPY